MVSINVNIPADAIKKVHNINYASIADATRVAQSLKDSGIVTQGDIDISLDTVDTTDPQFNNPAPGELPLLLTFSVSVSYTNEVGRAVRNSLPFTEIAGELVFELDTKPHGTWVPGAVNVEGKWQGDMERR